MSRKRSWSIIGQPERVREDRGGKTLTLLAATSCFGVELFMIIEGGATAPVWCYFITEVQLQVVPKILKRNPGMKEEDILLLYDNCNSHNKSISSWWMRNIDAFKLTICPYTPEFNPIERLFHSIKFKASDGVERNTVLELTEFLVWHMN